MQELSKQHQELQDKGFIRPSLFRGEHQCRLLRRGAWIRFEVISVELLRKEKLYLSLLRVRRSSKSNVLAESYKGDALEGRNSFWKESAMSEIKKVDENPTAMESFGDWQEREILWRNDYLSMERDRLIGIGFVLDFVEFISFTFGDKEMIYDQLEWVLWYAPWISDQLEWICGMLHGLVINWSSSAIETSRNHVNGEYRDDKKDVRKSG
ncbi:hypothetical protein Tco_0673087 [Tanacetum coccineum]